MLNRNLIYTAIDTIENKKSITSSTKQEAIKFLRYIEETIDKNNRDDIELYNTYYRYLKDKKIIL